MDETLNHASRPYPMIGIAAVQPFLPARALDEMRDRFEGLSFPFGRNDFG